VIGRTLARCRDARPPRRHRTSQLAFHVSRPLRPRRSRETLKRYWGNPRCGSQAHGHCREDHAQDQALAKRDPLPKVSWRDVL